MSKSKWSEVVARDEARRREVSGGDKPEFGGMNGKPFDCGNGPKGSRVNPSKNPRYEGTRKKQ